MFGEHVGDARTRRPPLSWPGAKLAASINTVLSLNRLGRGNAALFLLLSFGAIGTRIGLLSHLILALTAALWYNGLNDLYDLELDRAAYAKSGHRKVLVNGAMNPRSLCVWLAVLTLASVVVLVVQVHANIWCTGLFIAGILSSVVYNSHSKYLAKPSIVKYIVLDAIVGGPFYFYYASLAVVADPRPESSVTICTIGSLLACGLYGNFIFAAKDLSTDANSTRTLPMMMGSAVTGDGTVRHSTASKVYLAVLFMLTAILLGYGAAEGHWVALAFAVRLLIATVQVCSGEVTERGHKKLFISLSNWEMAFLLSLYVWTLSPLSLAQLVLLGVVIVLANVAYFHDERSGRAVMLDSARRRAHDRKR
jgi:hypothetical protein